VEKKNIATFLQQKITEMGLNPQEKADFLDYWQPELIAKNTPYYRVSFLQTNELNELFPMQVTPQPDTTFRIFLDYTPLMAKPITLIQPQTLNKLTRNGFTMVEWGGLKR
jgi:internalin A